VPDTDAALTLGFADPSGDDLRRVGGKGANLAALTRAGVNVPPGFCVTTAAFERFMASLPDAEARFRALDALDGASVEAARAAAEAMRRSLESLPVPAEIASAVAAAWRALGSDRPYAVRSSATAEDLPGASFAGQQDTYLNVIGESALLDAVRRCWVSLFTDRAVIYRARGGFGHRAVKLAVVVQQMIDPEVSGILFTADPISGHRHVASIDAGFGLGEALVSGLISADLYKVDRRSGEVLVAQPGDKALAIRAARGGGTTRESLPESRRRARSLSDEQVRALADVGGRIEALYRGEPQDIEWCIAGGTTYVVQARPITSLHPVPRSDAAGLRVFASFGHLQMMVDAMPTLVVQMWRFFMPAGKARTPSLRSPPELSPVLVAAGGHLFIDVTGVLRVKPLRAGILKLLSKAYEALGTAIGELASLPEFQATRGDPPGVLRAVARILGPVLFRVPWNILVWDPAKGAAAFNRALEAMPRESAQRVGAAPTPAAKMRQISVEMNVVFIRVRRHLSRLLSGYASFALLHRLARGRWAEAVRDDVDLLSRGLPGNVTTQMDLAVGDLTDRLRPYPELVTLLKTQPWAEARRRLPGERGGPELLEALDQFLERYGDRGASEIDVSRPRWRDDPTLLFRVMAGGLSSGEAGAHRKQHEAQFAAGEAAAVRLVSAAGAGIFGPLRRLLVRRLVRVARLSMGLREHPKFTIVRILGMIRSEVLMAAAILVERGQLAQPGDVWHLGFDELAAALDDPGLSLRERATERAAQHRRDKGIKPPLAITSAGEVPLLGSPRKDLPAGALPGTPASAGVVEGLARVVTDPQKEELQAGEILVAPFTDPGWTPLFVHAAGVVTEVGGMMTHGAVVAREYGIPAVVSVVAAVERIKTGQRIRVDGTRGFVEIL
jgi:pyruvate,water dikinase